MNDNEINNRLWAIEQSIVETNKRIDMVISDMAKYATQSQVKLMEANLKNVINANSQAITDLQNKLNAIALPDETRYYLTKTEVEDFRTRYKMLIAMMSDAERLYQSIISYTAQINQ